MKLCVIIPALNEEVSIGQVVGEVPREIDQIDEIEVIVVDDGSTDRTAQCAAEAGALVLRLPVNRGVGAAIHAGFNRALERGADLVVNLDGDGQFNPADIPKLLAPLLAGEAGFVSASRFLDPELEPEMSALKRYGNYCMSLIISFLTGERYRDVSCGFRAYTQDTLFRMNLHGLFTYTQEAFLDLSFKGVPIKEVPIRVRGTREHGRSRIASNIPYYAFRTSKIIFRSFVDYKPMRVLGSISSVVMIGALALAGFLLKHYIETGNFTPHKWAGFTAAALAGMGLLIFITGLLADMISRVRVNQERILYQLRKNRYAPLNHAPAGVATGEGGQIESSEEHGEPTGGTAASEPIAIAIVKD